MPLPLLLLANQHPCQRFQRFLVDVSPHPLRLLVPAGSRRVPLRAVGSENTLQLLPISSSAADGVTPAGARPQCLGGAFRIIERGVKKHGGMGAQDVRRGQTAGGEMKNDRVRDWGRGYAHSVA